LGIPRSAYLSSTDNHRYHDHRNYNYRYYDYRYNNYCCP
jgi:hypothetical protein